MENIIETKNLSMKYPIEKGILSTIFHPFNQDMFTALKNVNIKVKKGEIYGLLGQNGAGKTTLIKILSTLLIPTKGTALVNGYDVAKNPEKVKEHIGLVTSEERSFYYRLTARQNLRFYASLHDIYGKKAESSINKILSLVDLKDKADVKYDNFSTGMKQRLLFARGLLNNPSIIFMDEPTKGLDVKIAKKIKRVILDLKEKEQKTVFLTTHNMQEAEELCDNITIINKGSIVASGTLKELQRKIGKKRLDEIFLKTIR